MSEDRPKPIGYSKLFDRIQRGEDTSDLSEELRVRYQFHLKNGGRGVLEIDPSSSQLSLEGNQLGYHEVRQSGFK